MAGMKMEEETVICRMCLEPIFNFICVDCLGDTVSNWLGSARPELSGEFQTFHKQLLKYIRSDNGSEKCIKCKTTNDAVMCPYCYQQEVFWWVFNKDINLSRTFARLFNFDFLGVGYLPRVKTRNLEPVILVDRREASDINMCDSCDQTSDDLKEKDGSWLCESCRD
ncbi:MAG TPA: hypothetical protein VJ343_01180 [archaeon]|nr:hypothetical protein [archaeon]